MAKTFTSNLPAVSTGDVLTATAQNNLLTTLNSHTVPPAASTWLTTTITNQTNNTAISFSSSTHDTDSMFSAGSPTRLTFNTAGIYLVTFSGIMTAATTLTYGLAWFSFTGGATTAPYGASDSLAITSGTQSARWNISTVYNAAAADYVEGYLGFTATGNVSIDGTTNNNVRARMTATFMGRTS